MSEFILPIIGIISLIFRIWVTEYKLKDELDFRRRYFSRVLAIFFCIALVYNFKNMAFNIICIWSVPFLIFATMGWDVKFFRDWGSNRVEAWKKHRGWMFLERITLHIPQLIIGIYMLVSDLPMYILGGVTEPRSFESITSLLYVTVILYASYMVFDVRYCERHGWPIGRNLLLLGNIPLILIWLYVLLWHPLI